MLTIYRREALPFYVELVGRYTNDQTITKRARKSEDVEMLYVENIEPDKSHGSRNLTAGCQLQRNIGSR